MAPMRLVFPTWMPLALIALLTCAVRLQAADETIWIEGEAPSGGVVAPWTVGSAEHADYLSGGQWLCLNIGADKEETIPESGLVIGWDFTVATAGHHELWERYGLESIRAPWDWRVDGGAWSGIPTQLHPFADMMEAGFFCELCWTHLGDADLAVGKHRIELRLQRQYDGAHKPQHVLHNVDCFCISSAPFLPNGRHRPGEAWTTAADQAAVANHFTVQVPAGDQRASTPLAGAWSVTRYDEFEPADRSGPDRALPPESACLWSAITVPGDKYAVRPDLALSHRLVYRTTVDVAPALIGHGFVLHFPEINMIGSVFVNGQFCGWTRAMLTDWDCDITPAVVAGSNQLCVVIKDTYYAFSPQKAKRPWSSLSYTPPGWVNQNWFDAFMDFPVSGVSKAGLIATPSVVVCGSAYASDVFVKPSFSTHQLGVEITVRNPGPAPVTATLAVSIVPEAGGAAELSVPAQSITIPAASEQVVSLSQPWVNPTLWWPDAPFLYHALTSVSVAGRPGDALTTTFGFREWGWNSDQFTLNGIPWHFHADGAEVPGGAAANLGHYQEHSQNIIRMMRDRCWGLLAQEALDLTDRSGMVVRRSGIMDGEGANYLGGLVDQTLFDHWTEHLKAWVRAERNHPSVLIWSIENEVTYINSRNLGLSSRVEPMVAKAAQAVMALDPTRPVMVDGGRCLIKEDLPVNGCHYDETDWRCYPDEAYTCDLLMKSHLQHWNGFGKSPWRLVPDRPVFMGEAYFLNGYRPGDLASWGGEEAFTGWTGARHGGTVFAKVLSEGYRWHGIAAFHFSLDDSMVDSYYNSWKPVAVLVRQWDWTFAGGSQVERTIRILNDTRFSDPISLTWSLDVGGKRIAGEAGKAYQIAPGGAATDSISFSLPKVAERTAGSLTLALSRKGLEVFSDVKPLAVIDSDGGPRPALPASDLAVLDPHGQVAARLAARGLHFTPVDSVNGIPATARIVIVGPDALDPVSATGTQLLSVAARGGRVLVLDQDTPLQSAALPADVHVGNFTGRVAFSENLDHPIFASLAQADFFTWAGDELLYRNVYSKPTRGAISLCACEPQLAWSALLECRVNDGVMMLCQLDCGSKLATNPVAQRLFDNLLGYCDSYAPLRKSTAVAFDPASTRGKLLSEIGLVATPAADPLSAMRAGKDQIVVFDATPGSLASLAGALEEVHAFTAKGGWLFAWGLTPEGLASFNRLTGVEQLIRPFRRERVLLPAVRDPVLSGLGMGDVVMDSSEAIAAWMGRRFAASDSYSYVLDYDDIAPFAAYPSWKQFNPGKQQPDADKDPLNLVNGFTSQDDWRYIFQLPINPAFLEWDITLPRAEVPTQLDVVNNGLYRFLSRIELTFDGDPARMSPLLLKPAKELVQSFPLPAKAFTTMHVKLAEWQDSQAAPVVGIDNWWIKVQRSPDFYAKVRPLLNIGAMIKYPQGQGGMLLCNLNVPDHESNPENGPKRRNLVGTLLRNLGAVFAGGRTIVAGAGLSYHPLALGDSCNLFLSKAQGWFTDEAGDLAAFPVGDNRFAGVSYAVRDSRTSPLPVAITLDGGALRIPVPKTVTGIPLNQKASALFFLQTWKQTAAWQPPRDGDRTPPVIWAYAVHYADGTEATVPVRYDDGCGPWLSSAPRGTASAEVAWSSPLPGGGKQAVVYQMQWTNPRPEVAIATIDLGYDPKVGNRYGEPVVLGITAAQNQP